MSEKNIASGILLKRLYKTKEKLDNRIKKTTEHREKLNQKISEMMHLKREIEVLIRRLENL